MRIVRITISLLLVTTSAMSQRLYNGQKAISFAAGFVDHFSLPKKDKSGLYGQIAFSRINANRTRWVFGIQGSEKYYQYQDQVSPANQYVADISLYIPALVNYRRNLILSVGVGATAGYENVSSDNIYKNDVALPIADQFIYGGFIGAEGEIFLANKVVWFINFKERVMGGSDIENVHVNLGTGIKIMLKN